ncbi:MAG: hypothetical protein ABSH47_16300 [Bryobacteraceae bacterium]|jgi:hypothetical protein
MLTVAVSAQQAKNAAPAAAPVPEQIAKAKTVFVSNAGADMAGGPYSGGDDRPYNQLYAAIKSWGRYELAPAPAGSDLIFELLFIDPVTGFDVNNGSSGRALTDPQLRLAILDPSTHVVLWAFSRHVKQANRQATSDKNFDDAMASLVAAVKELAARPVAGH